MVDEKSQRKVEEYNEPVIISILRDISYPRKRLVATFLHNLQVTYLDA